MKKIFSIICFVLLVNSLIAQEKSLEAFKINSPIKIDGILDEPVWKQAAIADSFIENSPNYGAVPKHPTIVRILYSDQAIYVGAYLYDDPKKIRKQLTARDGEQR